MTTAPPPVNPYVNQLYDSIPKTRHFLIFMSSQERGRPWCR